jgi:hypothetical protein
MDFDRIRENVQSMISQGAPETDIDRYLMSEKVTPDQLRKSAEAPVDPVRATVQKEFDEKKALGRVGDPTQRRMLQGMTFNTADEILAGLQTPFEMVKRKTFNPAEGYNYAKMGQDIELEDARKNGGVGGTLAEIGGGVMSGVGIGSIFGRGLSAGSGLLARTGASAADAATLGAASGLAEGNGIERVGNALQGLAVGGVLGAAAPATVSLAGQALAPVIGNIRARMNPQGYARSQVARGVMESGQTPDDIALAVTQAANDGQGMFTVADAMGNSGQRMLATTARSPGIARTNVTEFLDARQAGQGRRVAGQLAEGFDAPQTAQQARTGMTAARDAAADAEYAAVRSGSGVFDPSRVIARIDETIPPNPFGGAQPLADDSIEGTLRNFRARLTDGQNMLTDFRAGMRTRDDLADAAQAAVRAGMGKRAHAIGEVVREMDNALEAASGGYRQANRNFAQASRDIEAIDTGRTAALRGRSEDTVPQFGGLSQQGQAAFRTGYADNLIEGAQGAAFGVNKARPLINDAFAAESAAMAPGAPALQRQLGRENTMFQTRNAAMGNSKTAENLNDDAAMGIDVSMIPQLLSGNWGGALRTAMSAVSNGWNGNTAGVREEVARLLMQRGSNVNPRAIQTMLDETMRNIELVSSIARTLGRGGAGGVAVTPSATGNRR